MAKAKSSQGSDERPIVRYVVTVHGIGDQRKNETVLEPIYRFAKARRLGASIPNPLTLGQLTGVSEESDWIAFDGIPIERPIPSSGEERRIRKEPFFGTVERRDQHKNLRFVDMHWADIMEDRFDHVGIPLKAWVHSLLERLKTQSAPPWAINLLTQMKKALVPVQTMLSLRIPGFSDKIFNRFLGDVQLYGECATIRGQAVRRFHETMAKLQSAAEEEGIEPRYTIVAHSLGSIMSLDALMFAHSGDVNGDKDDHGQVVASPFRKGYSKPVPPTGDKSSDGTQSKTPPAGAWVQSVDAFVTIGSPIDKFLVLWPLNYDYLLRDNWISPKFKEFREQPNNKIKHYNYCDEQDPVGHELDECYLEHRSAVRLVFGDEPVEEKVFNRYWIPGVAHVNYWTDDDLFRRILECGVDQVPPEKAYPVRWFDSAQYRKVLWVSYFWIPFIAWLLLWFGSCWVWFAPNWMTRIVVAGVTVAIAGLMAILISLVIKWRRLMIVKRKRMKDETFWQRTLSKYLVRAGVYLAPFLCLSMFFGALLSREDPENVSRLEERIASPVMSADVLHIRDGIPMLHDYYQYVHQLVTGQNTEPANVDEQKSDVTSQETQNIEDEGVEESHGTSGISLPDFRMVFVLAFGVASAIAIWILLVFERARRQFRVPPSNSPPRKAQTPQLPAADPPDDAKKAE